MNLQSNSLFAYQVFDHFSSFLENTNESFNKQQSTTANPQSDNSFVSRDSLSELDSIDEANDFILKTNLEDKRMSFIMPPHFNNVSGLFFIATLRVLLSIVII